MQQDLIGAKPPEQATYAAAAYDDEDAGDAVDADENDFETSTASEVTACSVDMQ
jgi:hypothetical protein